MNPECGSANMVTRLRQDVGPRKIQSKYDYVKIKVWLGSDHDHYYILSRYLVSRTLTFTNKVPQETVGCQIDRGRNTSVAHQRCYHVLYIVLKSIKTHAAGD